MTNRVCITVVLGLIALSVPAVALADGTLPPLPYHYLHPPPAEAAQNLPPNSGSGSIPVTAGRSNKASVFTKDGQAGLEASAGAFLVSALVRSVQITLTPVDSPPGLPSGLTTDGNAYRIDASVQPGGGSVTLRRPVSVVLSWPHIPVAVEGYRNGAWHRICYSSSAILTPSLIICHASALGIVASIVPAAFSNVPTGTNTPTPASPTSTILGAIPFILGFVVIIVAAAIAYFVSRPRKRA